MVSFEITSLFTNLQLDNTIEIILKSVYKKREIITTIPKREMKELSYLCTKMFISLLIIRYICTKMA